MINFVSVDAETTGLDHTRDQVLELGAVKVIDGKIADTFHRYIKHSRLSGNPYALSMNAEIIKQAITNGVSFAKALDDFNKWLGEDKILFAGKNFGSFDLRFLENYLSVKYYHRYLDPMMLYLTKDDTKPIDLQECCNRAGMKDIVTHTALEDAELVAKLLIQKLS